MNELRKLGLLILTIMFGCLSSMVSTAEDLQSALSIQVHLKDQGSPPALIFELANRSTTPLVFDESALPWGGRRSVLIVGATVSRGALSGAYPVDDRFKDEHVTLKPGEKLTGEVRLDMHIAGISEALRKGDVVVFWYFEPEIQGRRMNPYGGWVRVPRRS
jgi:hypothetical protein